jgi:hypothetical protein
MSFLVAAVLLFVTCALALVFRGRTLPVGSNGAEGGDISADRSNGTSVLQWKSVQRSIENGAPPTPWIVRGEDREAMAVLERFFARAIPNPTSDGRPFVEETLGHGGPQLELRVPILSTKTPVAVLARTWDPVDRCLESNLYFFGAVDGRLAKIVSATGFESKGSSSDFTLYRNRQGFARRRSA